MVSVSVAVSSLMAFVVSLMIRSAIAEATNRITQEMHGMVGKGYVSRDSFDGLSGRVYRLEESKS